MCNKELVKADILHEHILLFVNPDEAMCNKCHEEMWEVVGSLVMPCM